MAIKPFQLSKNKWMLQTFLQQAKHNPVELGDILIRYYAKDSVNKIDSRYFKGLYRGEVIKRILKESDFDTEKAKAGEMLSLYGKCLCAIIMVDNQPQIAFFEVTKFEAVRSKLLEVTADAGWEYQEDNTSVAHAVFYRWWIERDVNSKNFGRVIRSTIFEDAETKQMKNVPGKSDFVYPKKINQIPAKIIRNNPTSEPDMINSAQILMELNVLGSEVSQEWEFIKTQLINLSTTFGQGKKSAQRELEIVSGNRISDTQSPNSKFQQAFQTVISGSPSLQQLIQTIQWFEDKALKYSFGGRELESSGTNKHSMQVGMFAQSSSEYSQLKKEQRQRDYNSFFNDILKMFVNFDWDINIQIQNTAFEDGKIEGMRQAAAQRELLEAQQGHFDASKEKALADAEQSLQKANLAKEQAKRIANSDTDEMINMIEEK